MGRGERRRHEMGGGSVSGEEGVEEDKKERKGNMEAVEGGAVLVKPRE